MENFTGFELPNNLQTSLKNLNFIKPTPIQAASIPLALKGKDILGSAQTGTGKTAAFGIPLIANLLHNQHATALVLVPTRELAAQVMKALQQILGRKSDIKTALLIGGDSMSKQLFQMRSKPRLIVGTPGRVNDHLERATLNLQKTNFLVLDETDRMLDMGFSIQIAQIIKFMPKQRQTLLFSATMPKNIIKIADTYLKNPERIAIGKACEPAKNIKQEVVHVTEDAKYSHLVKHLSQKSGSIVVFVKTKYSTEKIAKKLQGDNFTASAIHGDLRHTKRESVIRGFRNSKYQILIATDIAARGLDIPHIEHVINYDLPQCPEDYIHRIGRTARAGAKGEALCLVAPGDKGKWNIINRLISGEQISANDRAPQPRKKRSSGKNYNKGFKSKVTKGKSKRRFPKFS